MLCKYLLVPAVLAIGNLLTGAGAVQAQRGSGGHGGGGGHAGGGSVSAGHVSASSGQGSATHSGGYLGGGYSSGGFSGGYHHGGHHGDGYNIGGYYGGGPYYGGGTGYYGGLPFYGAGVSSGVPYTAGGAMPYSGGSNGGYAPSSPSLYQPYQSGSARLVGAAPDASSDDAAPPNDVSRPLANGTARIEVIVPDPQARVFFDGALTQQTGTDRLFTTPPLTASGTYRIRASWTEAGREMIQEKVVTVAPNQTTVVDFTRPAGG